MILKNVPENDVTFSELKVKFLNFQLKSVEYSDTCIWKFLQLVTGIISRFG